MLVSLIISNAPISKKIDITLQGKQCNIGDSLDIEDITVTIKGRYRQYFLKDNTFNGKIYTSIHGYIWGSYQGKLIFEDNISTIYMKSDDFVSGTFGTMVVTSNFSEVLILVHEQYSSGGNGWTGENGTFISVALEIAKMLSEKSVWLSNTV